MSARLPRYLVLLFLLLCAAPARAQIIGEAPPPPFPDPKRFSRGLFAEGDLGAVVFLGRIAEYAGPGPQLSIRVGYDLTRWLALFARVGGSIAGSEAPAPYNDQRFQVYRYTAELRLQAQIRRVGLWLTAGGGLYQVTTNLLDVFGVSGGHSVTAAVVGGGGIDFHTLNRHYSVGLGADYGWLAQFDRSHVVTVSTYLRYTR